MDKEAKAVVRVSRKKFLAALAAVKGAVTARGAMPVLECVRVTLDDERLVIEGTNLDVYVKTSVPVVEGDVEKVSFCLSAPRLNTIVKRLEGEYVVFDRRESDVVLTSKSASFELAVVPGDDFPDPMMGAKSQGIWTGAQKELAERLRAVVFAASVDPGRYVLGGVHFLRRSDEMRVAATDGRRMCRWAWRVKSEEVAAEFIVPLASTRLVAQLLTGDGAVSVSFGNPHVRFVIDGEFAPIEVQSKLIAGPFPDIDQVVPDLDGKRDGARAVVFREPLRDAVVRVASVLNKKNPDYGVGVAFAEEMMELWANGGGVGTARELVKLSEVPSDKRRASYNPDFLTELLGAVGDEELGWWIGDKNEPLVVANKRGWLGILMPLRQE